MIVPPGFTRAAAGEELRDARRRGSPRLRVAGSGGALSRGGTGMKLQLQIADCN